MKKLRVAFLAYNLEQGGAERQLFYIVKMLIQQDCHPDVFTFSGGGYWEGPIRALGARVVCIDEPDKISRLRKLVLAIKRGKYHYVHSQQFGLNLYAVAISLLCNIRCIGSIRNNVISEVHDVGLLGWFSLILPKRIVANSRLGMENAKKYFRNSKSIIFLPNIVDTETFFPGKAEGLTKSFKVITVGTVWKPKRVDRVIQIAEILKRRASGRIIFEIIGDGEQLDDMIAMAKSKGLLNSVLFFRGRSNDIASDYRQADALLLTSDFEGTPNVVLEAMSSGLPVIASRVGDIPMIIEDGKNGFSAECDDLAKMADIIEVLSRNRALCSSIGKKARDFVVNAYSPGKLSERLTKLYFPDDHLL